MAILFPVVLLFIYGLSEFARAIWIQATLDYAVQAAARCAAVDTNTCANSSQTQVFAASRAVGLTISSDNFSVSTESCGTRVAISLPYQFSVPNLFPQPVTLTASACYSN
jgi:Flp pilus assembly protein TadG